MTAKKTPKYNVELQPRDVAFLFGLYHCDCAMTLDQAHKWFYQDTTTKTFSNRMFKLLKAGLQIHPGQLSGCINSIVR